MAKPCRLTFQAFKLGEDNLGIHYDIQDIVNSREWCHWLVCEGYSIEPHDNFNLTKFIEWCDFYLRNHKQQTR